MTVPHPIIVRLAERRRVLGISQRSMARSLSVSVATFSNWEQGRHEPHLAMLTDWAALLNLSLGLADRQEQARKAAA